MIEKAKNFLNHMAFSSKGQDARLSISKWCVQVTQVSPPDKQRISAMSGCAHEYRKASI